MRKGYLVFLVATAFLLTSLGPAFSQGRSISLVKPKESVNVDLIKALQMRKSTKSYSTNEISMEDLATILWAANGVNRPDGKRTAPSAYGRHYMNLYVVGNNGVYLYEPANHELISVTDENIKGQIAKQEYVGEASHIIVMTAELSKFHPMTSEDMRIPAANATAGCIAQNIYLVTNAMNMGTSYVLSMKPEVIKDKLKLKEDEILICIMPIGYPKE